MRVLAIGVVLGWVLGVGPAWQASRAQTETAPVVDYDAQIAAARAAGDHVKAAYLKQCRDTPAGTTVTIAPAFAVQMERYCPQRNFTIQHDRTHVRPPRPYTPPSPAVTDAAPDPALAACRAAAHKHIIECWTETDYQACDLIGCPDVIKCDKRLTRCDDHGAPYGQRGTFYCDTRNARSRSFDYDAVVAAACPVP